MSDGPRTLFAAAVLVASFAVGGCSGEPSSSHAESDASPDPGATPTSTRDVGGLAGGSGKDADEDAQTDDPSEDPGHDDDGDDKDGDRDSGDDSSGNSKPREDAESYLREAARALHKRGGKGDSVRDTATGAALDAALAQAAEFNDNGWHQVGVPHVVSMRIVDDRRDEDPPRMTISACVDSSEVDVVDASGESVRHGSHADRSRMIYTLVRNKGDWLVERETFPNNPEC